MHVVITTRRRSGSDMGAIEEGEYNIEGDELVLSSRFGTIRKRIPEGANPPSIAQQALWEQLDRRKQADPFGNFQMPNMPRYGW